MELAKRNKTAEARPGCFLIELLNLLALVTPIEFVTYALIQLGGATNVRV